MARGSNPFHSRQEEGFGERMATECDLSDLRPTASKLDSCEHAEGFHLFVSNGPLLAAKLKEGKDIDVRIGDLEAP